MYTAGWIELLFSISQGSWIFPLIQHFTETKYFCLNNKRKPQIRFMWFENLITFYAPMLIKWLKLENCHVFQNKHIFFLILPPAAHITVINISIDNIMLINM